MKNKIILFSAIFILNFYTSQGQVDSIESSFYFTNNSYFLDSVSKSNLAILVIKFNSSSSITMIGRSDRNGTEIYNDQLSLKRIKSIIDFLFSKGVDSSKLKNVQINNLGNKSPILNTDETYSYNANRVVTIKLVSNSVSNTDLKKDSIIVDNNNKTIKTFQEQLDNGSTKIILNNINFEPGRHFFLQNSYAVLEEIVNTLKSNPTVEIEIQGHICCHFDSDYRDGIDPDSPDVGLSVSRAREVYRYLINHGINSNRMTYKGFGDTINLVFPEITPEDQAKNRRVEFIIIKR